MQRDILFLASGIPADRMFRDQGFFFATPDDTLKEMFRLGGQHIPALRQFIDAAPNLTCFGARTDKRETADGIEQGFQLLSGILDGVALAVEASTLRVCHVALVREAKSDDLDLHIFVDGGGWATFAGSEEFQRQWKERQDAIYDRLLMFVDIVNRQLPHSEITDQLQCSAKMYRHGAESRVFGLQFLAKFSAVEGLVCGSERNNHGRLLRTRVAALFSSVPSAQQMIGELWNYRCSASHQARAFEQFGAVSLPAYIPYLDFFFLGLFVFALDHCTQAKTFNDLWSQLPRYSLPPKVLIERPDEAPRYAIRRAHHATRVAITGNGRIFDQFFK